MFATIFRQQEAFQAAQSVLSYDTFADVDRQYALVWEAVHAHFEEFEQLPHEDQVRSMVGERLQQDKELLNDREKKLLKRFLDFAYSVELERLETRIASRKLSLYVEDRIADSVRAGLDGYTPVNIREMLEEAVTKAEDASAVGSGQLGDAFETDWVDNNEFLNLRDTGIEFINAFLGGEVPEGEPDEAIGSCDLGQGGHACGESYGLLGPYGGGKTTLATMLSVRSAEIAYEAWEQSGRQDPLRMAYHFSWEEPKASLRLRALAILAEVPHKRLKMAVKRGDLAGILTNSNTLLDYERRKWAHQLRQGQRVMGEYERVMDAIPILNHCWRVVDLTGSDKTTGYRGTGLVNEIASIIRQDQNRKRDYKVGVQMVIMDYVGAAAERYLDHKGLPHDGNLRHLVNRWPMHARDKVAVPFNCPVWSVHQLSTTANSMSPGAAPKYTDSAEGKAFAESLDFCIMLGMKDGEMRMLAVCNKSRREAPLPPKVLRLRGALQLIVDESAGYTVKNHKITARSDVETIQGGAVPSEDDDDQPSGAPVDDPRDIQQQNRSVRPPSYKKTQAQVTT